MYLRLIFLFCFSLLLQSDSFAQSRDSLSRFHYQQVWPLYQQGKLDSAVFHAREALELHEELLEEASDSIIQHHYAYLHKYLGEIALRKNQLVSAEDHFQTMLASAEENFGPDHGLAALSHYYLAITMQYRGAWQEAISFQRSFLEYLVSLSENDLAAFVKHYTNLRLDQAASTYELLARAFLSFNHHQLGYFYRTEGEIDQAIFYHLKGLELRKQVYGNQHPYVAFDYRQLASVYNRAKNFNRTTYYLEKALEIQLALSGEMHPTVADIYNEYGVGHFQESEYQQALAYWQKVLAIRNALTSTRPADMASAWNNLGLALGNLNRLQEAIEAVEKAGEIQKTIYGTRNPNLIQTYNNLAQLNIRARNYPTALQLLDTAVALNVPGLNAASQLTSSQLDQPIADEMQLAASLNHLGLLFAFPEDAPEIQDRSRAEQYLRLAAQLHDRHSNTFHYDWDRLRSNVSASATDLIRIEYLYQQENPKERGTEFYEIFERLKSQVLRKAILEKDLMAVAGVPLEITGQVVTLRKEIRQYAQELEKLSDGEKKTQLQDQLLASNRSYDSLFQYIEARYPDYYQLNKSETIIPLETVQQHLRPGTVMMSMFEANNLRFIGLEDGVFVLVISPEDAWIHKVVIPETYGKQLRKFQNALRTPDFSQQAFTNFCKNAHQYYQFTLGPVLDHLEKEGKKPDQIVIVPDDNLHYLPFELLLPELPDTNRVDYRELPYLFKHYAITYANSASLWVDQQEQNQTYHLPYLGFAPQYSGTTSTSIASRGPAPSASALSQLTGTVQEVEQAHDLLGGRAFLRENATEANFKKLSKNPAILHLAMHATVNDQNPMQSVLYFTPDSLSEEDGQLYAYEIYAQPVRAQLAILSACATGMGSRIEGEGILSLSRAFTFAGCPSITMSLWQASDKYTASIMTSFLQELQSGKSKGKALREAKLQHLNTTDQIGTHPANWATFVMLGNDQPVNFPSPNSFWWYFLAIALVAVVIGYYFRKKPS